MLDELLTILRDIGNTIYEAFVFPGSLVLSKFTTLAPTLAETLRIAGDDPSILWPVMLSVLAWLLVAALIYRIFCICQNLVRIVNATFRTIAFRIRMAFANFKTSIVCRFGRFIPRRAKGIDVVPEVEFDDLDLAVLRSAAARGPGFATSAPELADLLTLRPAQVQRSLDKLSANKMLEYVIGSTDGYDNYRLSPLGSAFMANWQRQHSGA